MSHPHIISMLVATLHSSILKTLGGVDYTNLPSELKTILKLSKLKCRNFVKKKSSSKIQVHIINLFVTIPLFPKKKKKSR